jgi:hypothetical protein
LLSRYVAIELRRFFPNSSTAFPISSSGFRGVRGRPPGDGCGGDSATVTVSGATVDMGSHDMTRENGGDNEKTAGGDGPRRASRRRWVTQCEMSAKHDAME